MNVERLLTTKEIHELPPCLGREFHEFTFMYYGGYTLMCSRCTLIVARRDSREVNDR